MGGEKGGDAPGGTVGSQQHSMACLSIKFTTVQPKELGPFFTDTWILPVAPEPGQLLVQPGAGTLVLSLQKRRRSSGPPFPEAMSTLRVSVTPRVLGSRAPRSTLNLVH